MNNNMAANKKLVGKASRSSEADPWHFTNGWITTVAQLDEILKKKQQNCFKMIIWTSLTKKETVLVTIKRVNKKLLDASGKWDMEKLVTEEFQNPMRGIKVNFDKRNCKS